MLKPTAGTQEKSMLKRTPCQDRFSWNLSYQNTPVIFMYQSEKSTQKRCGWTNRSSVGSSHNSVSKLWCQFFHPNMRKRKPAPRRGLKDSSSEELAFAGAAFSSRYRVEIHRAYPTIPLTENVGSRRSDRLVWRTLVWTFSQTYSVSPKASLTMIDFNDGLKFRPFITSIFRRLMCFSGK